MSLLLLALALPARAQDHTPPAVSTSLLRPAPDATRALALPEADVRPGWTTRADLQYLRNPLLHLDEDGHSTAVLASVLQLDLGASWGLGNLRLAATAPAVLRYQGDSGLPGSTLGDPAAELKIALLPRPWQVSLALLGGLSLPLGGYAVGLGEDGVTGQGGLLVDGQAGPLWLAGQAGARFRPQQAAGELVLDDSLQLRSAASLHLQRTDLTAELLSETALDAPFADYRSSPTELLLSVSHARDSGLLLRVGGGLGLVAGPGAPAWRLIIGVGQAGG